MKIETKKGKHGTNDRLILFSSTDRDGNFKEKESVTIFKIGLLVNQIAFNELEIHDGYKKRLLAMGKELFFEEAIKESVEMAKNGVNWAESHNYNKVKDWAKNGHYQLKILNQS